MHDGNTRGAVSVHRKEGGKRLTKWREPLKWRQSWWCLHVTQVGGDISNNNLLLWTLRHNNPLPGGFHK